jgi:hypothetical protein
MGYKGDSYMDSGYFYCPYVPLTQTPTVLDPDSFTPKKGIMTRYGKKLCVKVPSSTLACLVSFISSR